MTTFTTEDRIIAEKDGSFTVNAEANSSMQIYRDLEFPGFNLRFIKQGNDWVCTMPDWLMDQAIIMASGLHGKGSK